MCGRPISRGTSVLVPMKTAFQDSRSAVITWLRRRFVPIAVIVLVAGAFANLATTLFVPVGARPAWKHGGGDLGFLVHRDDSSTEDQYGFYVDLGAVARDGTLVVPPGSWVDPHTARGLAGVAVETRDYPPAADALLGPVGERTGRVLVAGLLVPYWIVPGPPTDVFWLASFRDGFAAVPSSVAPVPGGDD